MATVTGFTAERMLVIENETVVDGEVVGNNLHLLRRDGVSIDAGNVRGPVGATGAQGPPGTNGTNGTNGKDGVIQSVNDVSAPAVYSPRVFANKAAIDAWATAPNGAMALAVDTAVIWQKDSTGWFVVNNYRLFASVAERDSRWVSPPEGSRCTIAVAPPSDYQYYQGAWRLNKLHYSRGYGVFGAPSPNWPTKTLSGRAQVTTDAAGRVQLNMAPIYTEAGVNPLPSSISDFHVIATSIGLQCTFEENIPWADVNTFALRFFTVTGVSYQAVFNIMFTMYFQNGAT